jgi:hypothetical protein
MNIAIGNRCVLMNDTWDIIESYTVVDVQPKGVLLRPFTDILGTGPTRKVEKPEVQQIFVTPYQAEVYRSNPRAYSVAALVDDLAGALLGHQVRIAVADLIRELKSDPRLAYVPDRFLQGCLRTRVASKDFVLFTDDRKKNPVEHLELSTHRRHRERDRIFASSFAHELKAQSQRIRSLISHTGTVGTYRECLLQTLLRKSLPERYHVATGFIHGCSRQLDILIYDRLDYAPWFREGDLVVVPKESVRAVIEVKTDLTAAAIRQSLSLLNEVAYFDDLNPPFFKGVFGFESSIPPQQIYSSVEEFYAADLPDDPDEIEDPEDWPTHISEPFRHVSSVCVLGHAYAQVDFLRDEKKRQYIPTLMHASSVSGLDAQAAYFLQHLLAYLRSDGLKATESKAIGKLLGADTRWNMHGSLAGENGWSWGAYFQRDEMDQGEEVVAEMEKQLEAVTNWLKGARWA